MILLTTVIVSLEEVAILFKLVPFVKYDPTYISAYAVHISKIAYLTYSSNRLNHQLPYAINLHSCNMPVYTIRVPEILAASTGSEARIQQDHWILTKEAITIDEI